MKKSLVSLVLSFFLCIYCFGHNEYIGACGWLSAMVWAFLDIVQDEPSTDKQKDTK